MIRPMIKIALLALALLSLPMAAGAQDRLAQGLKVGERLPEGFAAADQTGTARDFASLKGERGLVLLFNRSVLW